MTLSEAVRATIGSMATTATVLCGERRARTSFTAAAATMP